MAKRQRKKDSQSVPSIFWELREATPELEAKPYFELQPKTKKLLTRFESSNNGLPKIEAWTFVPHPSVIRRFVGKERSLKRYILTVDTQRSSVYNKVLEFLEGQSANITAYYTGGWADFLCDIQLDEKRFSEFLAQLTAVLKDAGVERFENLDQVMSVFEVLDQIIICRRPLNSLSSPSTDDLEDILEDRNKFETVYRNYRSKETLELFGGSEQKLKSYLRKLKQKGIIVCYSIILDFSFGTTRDYVPMILPTDREALINKFLEDAAKDKNLLKPVTELVKVRPIRTTDEAEQDVNYIFLNEYEYPGEKKNWKLAVYSAIGIDVNLYNYPLESTLNESPIFLSDLPEQLNNAKAYQRGLKDKQLFIGWLDHPLLQKQPEVALSVNGLAFQGVTFGEPGTGKTNADLVLACEASRHLKSVVILDASGGISSKASVLPQDVSANLRQVSADYQNIEAAVSAVLENEGLCFLQTSKGDLSNVFLEVLNQIEQQPDATTSNEPRKVTRMLMVEEAGDALGGDIKMRERGITQLIQFLNKAWRKGWCLWLSTQVPSSLGYDKESSVAVIKLLRNRLISRVSDPAELEILANAFRSEGHSAETVEYVKNTAPVLVTGEAVCRGMEVSASSTSELPPVKVSLRFLDNRSQDLI